MQPQELHPNLHSVVTPTSVSPTGTATSWTNPTVTPTVPAETASVDQMIAQENARVFTFEHGAPELPKQHRLLDFIGQHKRVLLIAVIAFTLMSSGGTLAFVKLKSFTKAPATQTSTVASGNQDSSAAGGASGSDEQDTDSEDASSDEGDTGDTGDAGDEGDEGDTGGTGDAGDEGDEGDTGGTGDAGDEPEFLDESEPEDDVSNVVDDPISDTPVSTPAPTPVPAKPAPTLSHKFTTASWNTGTDNARVVGDQVLTLLKSSQVLGLQELRKLAQRNSVKSKVLCSTCAYSGYMPSYTDSSAGITDYTIVWNKASFTQVGSGSSRKMCDSAKTSSYSYAARYATWVRLQSKVNGKQIIVVNTHTMGVGESGGKPGSDTLLISRYKTHMTNLKTLLNQLKGSNVPIYVTGTFNVNYRYDKNAYTSWFPYATLKPLGVRSNWDVMNLSGIASTVETTGSSNRIVDYVFSWQRSDVTANAISVAGSRYGSDNTPVFYTTTIK